MVSATKDDIVVSLHNRSAKEDNGQMFRIALTLSAMTGTPVRIENIFAARNNKGLSPALVALSKWLADATQAEVEGNVPQSETLIFRPTRRLPQKLIKEGIKINPGSMTASSVLFFQAILPLLLFIGGDPKSEEPITLQIDGATNCLGAPSYEYLDQVFLPALEKYFGIRVGRKIQRRGWGQMTPDPRTVQKGTICFKFWPLEWGTTLKPRADVKLCDEDEAGTSGLGTKTLDNTIEKVVATIVTPSGMHKPLKKALEEDIENRFPGAKPEFKMEHSGHVDRVYVLLVAHADYCRWGRDLIMAQRLKDVNTDSLAKEISSKLSKELEDEVNGEKGGECPVDSFLQDQLVIYQCLAEGRSCFPRPDVRQTTEAALKNLHRDFLLQEDDVDKLAYVPPESNDSRHTHLARHTSALLLPEAKFFNGGKVCIGAGLRAGGEDIEGRMARMDIFATDTE